MLSFPINFAKKKKGSTHFFFQFTSLISTLQLLHLNGPTCVSISLASKSVLDLRNATKPLPPDAFKSMKASPPAAIGHCIRTKSISHFEKYTKKIRQGNLSLKCQIKSYAFKNDYGAMNFSQMVRLLHMYHVCLIA